MQKFKRGKGKVSFEKILRCFIEVVGKVIYHVGLSIQGMVIKMD